MKVLLSIAVSAMVLSACATSPKSFYDNPSKQDVTALCRAASETKDVQFQRDLARELTTRGMTAESCAAKIKQQNGAIAAVALIGAVAAVGVVAANGGGGGYSAPARTTDYDCAGGRGDGPYYVYGPKYVGSYDPYGLDADGDGMGCEANDKAYGA